MAAAVSSAGRPVQGNHEVNMYKKILVAVDDSATAMRGLDEAIKLAKAGGSQLCVLHVIEPMAVSLYPEAAAYAEDMFDALRDAGKLVLERAQARARKKGVEARSALIDNRGYPVAELIVTYANKWRADVIVLGTHGRRGFSHLLMGSDAESVVRSATMPVLLVRAPDSKVPEKTPVQAPAVAKRGRKSLRTPG